MPWKQIKSPTFRLPARYDLFIIVTSLIIGLGVIAFFALRSSNFF